MSDEHEEHPGLLDDDPALDYILYKGITKEDNNFQGRGNGGCLSFVLFMHVPPVSLYVLFDLIS